MKQCPDGGAKHEDTAAFCKACGASLEEVQSEREAVSARAEELLNRAGGVLSAGARKARQAAAAGADQVQKAMEEAEKKTVEFRAKGVSAGGWDAAVEVGARQPRSPGKEPERPAASKGFVDQSEEIMAAIGSNYLQNYLTGGEVSRSIGILTQKRFYYKGKNIVGTGRTMRSVTEEGVVSVEDITFTKFTHIRHTGFLLFGMLLTALAVVWFLVLNQSNLVFPALLPSIPFYILYFVKRSSLFLIAFPGGGFAFDVRWYPIADLRDFQRQLHLLKDHAREGEAA